MHVLRSVLIAAIMMVSLPVLSADHLHFIIISPDLPFTVAEMNGTAGKPGYVQQFTAVIARALNMPQGNIHGKFFNSYRSATPYIRQKKDVFIMSSVDYYLMMKNSLNLAPVADLVQQGGNRYHVVVKKGKYSNIYQLKGKTLSGSALYGNLHFLNKVAFNGMNISSYFRLKPTRRIYSAVKRVTRGRLDAVILNQRDYNKFKQYSFFSKLQVVYSSQPASNLGIMMVNTSANQAMKDRVLRAVKSISTSQDASTMLKANGIKGFAPVNQELLNATQSKYYR